ncbi:uncharacterized protein LOC125497734 [Beta vulgaris subsp. vulgaris]|uniref:uncharacterized protein LOC125497734 n=1 Tax=Beta vulgaris subsp. vulgaris TaxID=3555 RepID=UPI0025498B47|nr:uncharacterized protein LOC125497734 [Beta vulgaris subsp. vulgaris]
MSGGADMSSSTQPMSSTPHGSTTSPFIVEEFYVNDDDRVLYVNLENEEEQSDPPLSNATGNESEPQKESQPSKRKRAKVSEVWKDMESVKNMKTKCKHCHQVLSASGTTTHLKRQLKSCLKKKKNQRQQNMLNFLPSNLNDGDPSFKFVSALHEESLI